MVGLRFGSIPTGGLCCVAAGEDLRSRLLYSLDGQIITIAKLFAYRA